MKYQMQLNAFVLLATVAVAFAGHGFLAEKPAELTSCRLTDSNFKKCYADVFQNIFKIWKNGIPGIKSIGSLDPLSVKRILISQTDDNPLIKLNLDMTNVKITGLSDLKVTDINFDLSKLLITATVKLPILEILHDYKVKGNLFRLPLDGHGDGYMKIDDVTIGIHNQLKLRDEYDHTFADVAKLKVHIASVGGFHIDLKNLFNGQKELEESTNLIVNQNWQDIFAVLRPAISDTVNTIMNDHFKKVFSYVPVTYFIEDVPSAAEYSG